MRRRGLITADETWVLHYDAESKRQSSAWLKKDDPCPTKLASTWATRKEMLITFFDSQGMVYQHFVPPGQKINATYYCHVLTQMRKHVWRKRPGKHVILHHDNASSHTAKMTKDLVASFGWEVLEHPPYSPDLAPNDFYLFPKLKKLLRGRHFSSSEELKREVQAKLHQLDKDGLHYAFDEWQTRWKKLIKAKGCYFE